MKNCELKIVSATVMLLLAAMGSALAGDDASALRGKIASPRANPAAKVNIIVKHLPPAIIASSSPWQIKWGVGYSF